MTSLDIFSKVLVEHLKKKKKKIVFKHVEHLKKILE